MSSVERCWSSWGQLVSPCTLNRGRDCLTMKAESVVPLLYDSALAL